MLWALVTAAWGHPGAVAHLAATEAEVRADPCDVGLRLSRARALASDERVDDALHELDHAEACGADPAMIALGRGVALQGSPERALPWLDAAVRSQPRHAGARATRAAVHQALGDPQRALTDWRVVLERAPTADAAHAAARCAVALGRLADGLALLDTTAAELGAPSLHKAAVELALQADAPQQAWARLSDAPDTSPWWRLRARTLDALDEPERAAQARRVAASLEAR